MRATEEKCALSKQIDAVKEDVDSLKKRMTAQEDAVKKMRAEAQDGFKRGAESMREINVGVANLAHDFAQRFNNIEATVVAEKVEWGKTLRQILKWTAKVVLLGALVAMGVFTYTSITGIFK